MKLIIVGGVIINPWYVVSIELNMKSKEPASVVRTLENGDYLQIPLPPSRVMAEINAAMREN